MTKNNTLLPYFFACLPLLLSSELKAETATDAGDLSTLLSPQERALVEKELKKSKKEDPSQKEMDAEKSSNPYATLLQDSGVPTTREQEQSVLKKSRKRKSRHSSTDSYQRYKPGNRRPGDALKSRPAERSFGG